MADRLPPYPMLPNFNAPPNLLQQQHQHQQGQQQQQDSHQQSPFDPRMWQQMNQMQQQFRPRSGADIAPNQPTNPQMQEMMRAQMARGQAQMGQQQQQQQQQAQQQFGLGMGGPQMTGGGNNLNVSNQQQVFHDGSSNAAHMQQQGFPNMGGMVNPTGPSLQQQQQRSNLLQNPGLTRQLELIGMAQNQQPQNGINFSKFSPQQQQFQREREQQQQLQAQQNMNFNSPSMSNEAIRRPSPSHPPNLNQAMGTGLPGPQTGGMHGMNPAVNGGRRLPNAELSINERMIGLSKTKQELEMSLQELTQRLANHQAHSQDPNHQAQINAIREEINMRREQIQRVNLAAQTAIASSAAGIGAGSGNQDFGGGQPSWMSQANPSFNDNGQIGRGLHPQQQRPPGGLQASPSLRQAQPQSNPPGQGVSPGTAQMPMQQGGQLGPPIAGGAPFATQLAMQNLRNQQQQRQMGANQQHHPFLLIENLPPLEKSRFDLSYKNYCIRRGLKIDPQTLSIDNRPIDLYELHTLVMREGGEAKVTQREFWNVIGGRMGFVQFPGTDKDHPKSGPAAAQRLAHVYKEYLALFDEMYIQSARQGLIRKATESGNPMGGMNVGSLDGGAGGAAGGLSTQGHLHMMNKYNLSPQHLQAVMAYANVPLAQLQAQHIPQKLIDFVEANRAALQKTQADQKNFQLQFRPQPAQAPSDQGGIPGKAPGHQQLSGQQHAQQQAMLMGQQQLMRQQQMMQMRQQNGSMGMQAGNTIENRQQQQQNLTRSQQLGMAISAVQKIKHEYQTISIPALRNVDVPMDQRVEYNALIEQVYRGTSDIESKLHMFYFVLRQEDIIRRLISIVTTVAAQRSMLSSGNPRYIIPLESLRSMLQDVTRASETFANAFNAMNQKNHPGAHHPPQHPMNNVQHNDLTPDMSNGRPQIPHPSNVQASQQQLQLQQQASQQAMRPPVTLQQPPKRVTSQNAGALSTPSPAPVSASTPAASSSTPTATAGSPQASKSPKPKAAAKPKANPPARRKPAAKAVPPTHSAVHAEPSPTPSTNTSVKRAREEDPSTSLAAQSPSGLGSGIANEPSPPKRVKTEWEGPPSDALQKKKDAVENVKTEEDATVFLEQMTELIKMAAVGEGQGALTSDISETLSMILKGYGSVPDNGEGSSGVSLMPEAADSGDLSSPTHQSNDASFEEFFDFSFGALDEDESGSKPPTPDLVPSSSTNPSPESGSEADGPHLSSSLGFDAKTEEMPDPLRLGIWKEIDGGESAYYQAPDWKWDSPMPSLEQPWAIFPS